MNNRHNQARGQGFHALHQNWYEFPDADDEEAWMYTSEGSYAPVERVDFHTSTTAVTYSIEIIRDGAKPAPVHTTEEMPGKSFVTPLDASAKILGYEVDGVDFFGAGCMVVFTRNGGTVFNAGSCEWVNGLRLREPFTERITRNVLNKFSQR